MWCSSSHMANGAKVCRETCDRDLGEDTTMARTEFGSQHVLRKKSMAVSGQGRWSLPADTLLPLRLNSSPLVLRGDSHPISGTKVGEGHLSPCTLAITLPSPQLRSHKLQLFACGPGKKITTFIFFNRAHQPKFYFERSPCYKFRAHRGIFVPGLQWHYLLRTFPLWLASDNTCQGCRDVNGCNFADLADVPRKWPGHLTPLPQR